MKLNYDVLGNYIRLIDTRNKDNITNKVMGINIDKFFMPSVANVIGTDLSKYKLITKGKFACNPMHVGRDERLPVALYVEDEPALVSPAYFMFQIIDNTVLDENYLMMWFRRAEFDRICWLHTDGSVRGGITWDDICRMEIPVPEIGEQRKIVEAYKIVEDRIELKRKINDNLVNTTDTIFFKMFLEYKPDITVSFTDIVQLMGGGTPKTDEESFWNGDVLFFTPKDVSNSPFCISTEKCLTTVGLNNCSSRLYPPFTTFVTCRGTVGKLAMAGLPMAMNQSCYALKGKDNFPPFFVYAFTRYVIETMKKKASGAVFSALVTRDFEMEKVFEPSITDAILFQNRVEPLFTQILANTNEVQCYFDLQNTLLTQLSSH
ncbi:restriction endonuclease subunit S [Candidatus Ventrimonas sp. KK005]